MLIVDYGFPYSQEYIEANESHEIDLLINEYTLLCNQPNIYGLEAEDKKENIIKRIWNWIVKQWNKIWNWIRGGKEITNDPNPQEMASLNNAQKIVEQNIAKVNTNDVKESKSEVKEDIQKDTTKEVPKETPKEELKIEQPKKEETPKKEEAPKKAAKYQLYKEMLYHMFRTDFCSDLGRYIRVLMEDAMSVALDKVKDDILLDKESSDYLNKLRTMLNNMNLRNSSYVTSRTVYYTSAPERAQEDLDNHLANIKKHLNVYPRDSKFFNKEVMLDILKKKVQQDPVILKKATDRIFEVLKLRGQIIAKYSQDLKSGKLYIPKPYYGAGAVGLGESEELNYLLSL